MNKSLYVFLCLMLGGALSYGQSLRKADRLFEQMNYVEAAEIYEAYLLENPQNPPEVLARAAESYYNINQLDKSLRWYKELFASQGYGMEDRAIFRYILSLRGTGNDQQADEVARGYYQRKKTPELLRRFEYQKNHLDSLRRLPSRFELINLAVNSENSEFGVAFFGDQVVYSSSKEDRGDRYIWNNQPYLNIYKADRMRDGQLANEQPFLAEIQSDYHDATVTFSENLDTIYFTSNLPKGGLFQRKIEENNLRILRARLQDGKVGDLEELPFNSKDYSVGHPALSPDGRFLYFASDLPGGFGETDLYKVEIFPDGTTGEPINLGGEINTEGREMFPFFVEETLYFSSDGHYGMGGLDVFKSTMDKQGNFSTPINVGPPVNSLRDDFSFMLDPRGLQGYMASNRDGGIGDDDLYYFKMQCQQVVIGRVVGASDALPIAGAEVHILDESGKQLSESLSDEDGTFSVSVPCEAVSHLRIFKEGYTSVRQEIHATVEPNKVHDLGNLALTSYQDLVVVEDDQEMIKVNPIYFEFNKSDITPEGAKELDQVVYVLEEFEDLKIAIKSHTDSRGSAAYNLKLSEARAQSTLNYLLEKGIAPDRIESAKGYGEIDLRNRCADGVECSEKEHAQNRRTDFVIIKEDQE